MNPRTLNDGTLFFVKESAICTSVDIQEIFAISFLLIVSLKIAISMWSLLSKIWVEECTESETEIVCFSEDFDVITIVFQLQYLL